MEADVSKAVIPAAGLGTRFLPATKSTPKEMLPVVDKPAIQYVVEEAVQAGLTDILIITGRNKRAIEDHFDRNFELEHYLEQRGKHELLKEVQFASDLADIHYVRQTRSARPRARSVGRAPSRRRRTVRGAARRRPHGRRRGVAALDARRVRAARSFVSSRCPKCRPKRSRRTAASIPMPDVDLGPDLIEIRRIVEKPAREDAPSNLAVIGSLRVHARDLRHARSHRTGTRRRAATHRRDRLAARTSRPCSASSAGAVATTSGQKLDFLRANVELAARPGRPRPRLSANGSATTCDAAVDRSRDPARRRAGADPRRDHAAAAAPDRAARRARARARRRHRRDRSRCRRSPTPGWTGTRCVRPTRPVVCASSASCPRDARRSTPVGPGEAIRIMTGAPMPAGADAVVMVERTRADGRRRRSSRSPSSASTCGPRAATSQPGAVVFDAGTLLTPAHLGVLASLDVARGARVIPRPRGRRDARPATSWSNAAPLAPGRIRDSNRPMLLAVARRGRLRSRSTTASSRDDEAAITAAVERAADACDALLTSGAVSVGDYDFVKVVLERVAKQRGGHVALDAGRDQAGQAARVRDARDRPRVRPAGQSGLVARELRALRPARVAASSPAVPTSCATRCSRPPRRAMPRRSDGKLHLDRVRVCASTTAATCASGPASRRATCSRAWPAPTVLR